MNIARYGSTAMQKLQILSKFICIGVSWNDEDQDKFGKQVKYFCIMDSFHKMFQKSIHCPENVCN